MRAILKAVSIAACTILMAASGAGAESGTVYRETFEEYPIRQAVAAWNESSLVDAASRRRAVSAPGRVDHYATGQDPLNPANRVFGVANAAGPADGDPRRQGVAAIYTAASFTNRFTFTGRLFRGAASTRVGVAFHSSLPEGNLQYLLALSGDDPTFRLFASDGNPEGRVVSGVVLEPRLWYRFRIEVEDVAGASAIRARVWQDGTEEPVLYSIAAVDAAPGRPLEGRIGVWSAGGGEAWFDDLEAESAAAPQAAGPVVAIVSPSRGAVLDSARITVTGRVQRAVTVTVNGLPAIVDPSAMTFTAGPVELSEGPATITAIARDDGGASAQSSIDVSVDTRAPDLLITSPPAGACHSGAELEVRGQVFDPALSIVRVIDGESIVPAIIDRGTWSARIPAGGEGPLQLRIEAADAVGHVSAAILRLVVDRTPPSVAISESGAPFTGGMSSRAVALNMSAEDNSPTRITETLDGAPHTGGTSISAEGPHEYRATAVDCAGNEAEEVVRFTIDYTAPQIFSIEPRNGAVVGSQPRLRGSVSSDTVRGVVEPFLALFDVEKGDFVIERLPLEEGRNDLELVLFDAAGNESRTSYSLTVHLTAPTVEILNDDAPIAEASLFRRAIAPVIRSSIHDSTIVATLNGKPFVSGSTIAADGSYTLAAFATDPFGHQSETVTVAFAIDATPPFVAITSPDDGATLAADSVEIHGTISADATSVIVNGVAATLQSSSFSATVPLEVGPNGIAATASDGAGNRGSAHLELIRTGHPAIILTSPKNGQVTNRRATVVTGQVFAGASIVTVAGAPVAVDGAGMFTASDVILTEGENLITASVLTDTGATNEATARVIADRTPPHVRLLESGQLLANNARFPAQAVITAQTSEGEVELRVNGDSRALPAVIGEPGSHAVVATATDAAGNTTRIERTFTVGTDASAGCSLRGFDPADQSVVTSSSVVLTGRSGGATAVMVNGAPAAVSNSTFCALVELPVEGDNLVTISCPGGQDKSLVLRRITGNPSVDIVVPGESSIVTVETMVVSGSISADVVAVDVNGTAAVVSNGTYRAEQVRLSSGWNVIVVQARNAAARASVASRRVLHLRATPSISITSPLPSTLTGSAQTDVTGIWQNLDPATISNASVTRWSDTTGTFSIGQVDLQPGENLVTVTGRDGASRPASSSVTITRGTAPSIVITAPGDNTFVAGAAGESLSIEGSFSAAPGAIVEVNGSLATITGNLFSGVVKLPAPGITPVVARVTEPEGAVAIDAIRIHRTGEAPTILDSYPPPGAVDVARGALPLVLFSSPMERSSVTASLELATADGTEVTGVTRLDRDVATFVPSSLLAPGATYTVRVKSAARDLAGRPLSSDFSTTFTVAAEATAGAPSLTAIASPVCARSMTLRGTGAGRARIRIDLGRLQFFTDAAPDGTFAYDLPLTGQAGYHAVRVRTVSGSGESAAAEACFLVDCGGLRVVATAYDRTTNRLTINFSEKLSDASPEAFTLRTDDGRLVASLVAMHNASSLVLTPQDDLTARTFTLSIAATLVAYEETFSFDSDAPPAAGDGSGLVSGEVFDAQRGWPLERAEVAIGSHLTTTDGRGRYAARVPEGAHTIRVSAAGYATVWRQIVAPAGAAVIPIDVRLAREQERGLTELDAQTLSGLLPLGWSVLRAVRTHDANELTFTVPAQEIIDATQTLSAVRYREDRDEWTVISAVVNVGSDGRVTVPATTPGTYALVYGDRAPHLVRPPPAETGSALQGVSDACAATKCPPLLAQSFLLDPPSITPAGSTLATLTVDGTSPALFPSGSAVQASVGEELRLADGSRLSQAFTTDLILQRTLEGDSAVARFHLAPSPRAGEVVLEVGFSTIRIQPHPGRVDRGTLLGAEGGRVPGDGSVTIDVPAGATPEPIRATAESIEKSSFGSIAGFEVVSGFQLTLQRAAASGDLPDLLKPARITLPAAGPGAGRQHILTEVLEVTPYGRVLRLAAVMEPLGKDRVVTRPVDRAVLPVDGVVREGRYLLLAAIDPIAFATGVVRLAGASFVSDARITSTLGVADISRLSGLFVLPVPAAPFTLVPRTTLTGDGIPYTHHAAPPPGSVVPVGDLEIIPQPPTLASMFPAGGATDVSLTTPVKATFTPGIDPASIRADSIAVFDSAMLRVAGVVTAEGTTGVIWTLPPGARLKPKSSYTVAISPAIRAPNGAPFGRSEVTSFSTITQLTNDVIRPDRIRITIPDGVGHSRVVGVTGALPAGWNALAVRRAVDFSAAYQATAAGDGSFRFTIAEPVALTDAIDLQVINTAGAVAAIVPLTPFVTDDETGFVALPDRSTRHVAPDGSAVIVPAGAFGEPVVMTTAPATKDLFAGVPKFDEELHYTTSIRIDFDGIARQHLDVEIPVPPGTDVSGRTFLLGVLGESIRGPRVMIVDTLRIDNGRFTTSGNPASGSRVGAHSILAPHQIKDYLAGVDRSGVFAVIDMKTLGSLGLAWAVIEGVVGNADIFWDTADSLYAAAYYVAERGRIAIPVPRGKQFQVVGVDAATGLQAFSKVYDPLPPGDPGAAYLVPTPNADTNGPYPVFGSPFRVEVLDVDVSDTDLASVRNFIVRASGGFITARDSPDPLPAAVGVSLLNVSRGGFDPSRAGGLAVAGERGDRLILFIEEREVDPAKPVSITFSEPIYPGPILTDRGIDSYLHSLIKIEKLDDPPGGTPIWWDISLQASYRLDSGDRRLTIELPALERGESYRLSLLPDLADASGTGGGPGLKIGQAVVHNQTTARLADPLRFHFHVRAPGGPIASFDLPGGSIRDQALNGNVLFVAAQEGGIVAYDASDPAGMTTGMRPLGIVDGGPTQFWSVASDHHGRVYATGMTFVTGVLQTYRLEDFIDRRQTAPRSVSPRSGAFVSWTPGAAGTLGGGITGLIVSDRPEGIPRKVQILLQDDERVYPSRAAFSAATAATSTPIDHEFDRLTFFINISGQHPYLTQRITVENTSLDLRWSADATYLAPAMFEDVIARAGDRLRVIYNESTYAAIAILGYGIAIYDVNAMESNDFQPEPSGYKPHREQVRVTRAALRRPDLARSNPCSLPPLDTHAIPDLTYTSEAAILTRPGSSSLEVFALDPRRGVLDLTIVPPADTTAGTLPPDRYECERSPYGMVFRAPLSPAGFYDHPRLVRLREKFENIAQRPPFGRFNQVATHHWRLEAQDNRVHLPATQITNPQGQPQSLPQGARGSVAGTAVSRDYLLIAGYEYGLLVVEAGGTPPVMYPSYMWLEPHHLVDVIWVPHGAAAVRAIPRSNLATLIDGQGHALLVDVTRLDERFDESGKLRPDTELFPSAERAVGLNQPDPRVIWRSPAPVGYGTLAPVIDPDTGFLYIGQLTHQTMNILAVIDPRIRMKVDVAAANGLSEVGGVVPLGVDPPESIRQLIASASGTRQPDASLAAFRLEISLPGSIVEKLSASGNRLQVALESEVVAGAPAAQTFEPYPRSHLRLRRRDGSIDPRPASGFQLDRVVPQSMAGRNRHQKGYNKFVSPWIVAIADPRASVDYAWPHGTTAAAKRDLGCFSCDRPQHLIGKTEADGVWEVYSAGRLLAVRPDLCSGNCASTIFSGTPYAYLGSRDRMVARFSTVIADSVRPTDTLIAAHNPPVAAGALQETTYLHSGEVETAHTDLDAGGRAGWNVRFARTYRSRTLGLGPLGSGWEGNWFRRIRALPNGDVEYRDGSGEAWLFRPRTNGTYISPRGLYLTLSRTERGWRLVDQKSRVTDFDAIGRMVTESDQFADDPARSARGNAIRYLYGGHGSLAQVVDPVGRATAVRYYGEDQPGLKAGRLREIEDWRGRVVSFEYDSNGRLIEAALPHVVNTNARRPAIRYGYDSTGSSVMDRLELWTNLRTITDPAETAPRVTLVYGSNDARDRVVAEQWSATGESATFAYPPSSPVEATDALGQKRLYTLSAQPKDYENDRAHTTAMTEQDIVISTAPVGTIPVAASPKGPPRQPAQRTYSFLHDHDGLLVRSRLEGVRTTTYTYGTVAGAPGRVLTSTRTVAEGGVPGTPIERKVEYQPGTSFVQAVDANGRRIEAQEAHRSSSNKSTVNRNDNIETEVTHDDAGRVRQETSRGGTDPAAVHGSATSYDYYPDSALLQQRGMLRSMQRPGLNPVRHDYPSLDRVVTTDERNIRTEIELDAWLRPRKVVTAGPGLAFDESSDYDASGRLRRQRRQQGPMIVSTEYSYDPLGRVTDVATDQISVGGAAGVVRSTTAYDLTMRRVTRTTAGGATVVEELDSLGRVASRTTSTGSGTVREEFVYDLAGNLVWQADDHVMAASAFDVHGRAIATLSPDGTTTRTSYDAWGRPETIETTALSGAVVSSSTMQFTPSGRMRASSTQVGGGLARETRAVWDGGGRQTGIEVSGRVARSRFDAAGRIQSSVFGGGTLHQLVRPMERVDAAVHDGMLVQAAAVTESGAAAIHSTYAHDTGGNVIQQRVGSLSWSRTFDQAGNIVSAAVPDRPAAMFEHDGRGAVTLETKPGGMATIGHTYDAAGAPTAYRDPVNEVTESVNDSLGRPRSRTYADGTSETFDYDGQRLLSMRDRQGRVSTFAYNAAGQVAEVRGGGGTLLDRYEYDEAGRMTKWATADAVLIWEDFDLEGRPRKTTQTRIDASGAIIDSYVQEHEWNVHGERTGWTMPSYTAFPSSSDWTQRVIESRDSAGNVILIERVAGSATTPLLTASYRNAGRPEQRTMATFGAGAPIVRAYAYNSSGQMSAIVVSARGLTVAGADVTFDGLQVAATKLVGLSAGARANEWSYDPQGRLATSSYGRETGAPAIATEVLSPADDRLAHNRSVTQPGDPPSLQFASAAGHKMVEFKRGSDVRAFAYGGAERTDDGAFTYEYDSRGRMVRATQKGSGRRIHYFYSGNNRMVGRRAEYGPPYKLEDRPDVIAADGIPPDVTYVWDLVSDLIAAVYRRGASQNPSIDRNGGLLRQVIHGGLGYDDPVEVAVADPGSGEVHRLYPVFDEAATGGLQVVLSSNGEVIGRQLSQDSYGGEESTLAGAGVDRITVKAQKSSGGTLQSVMISVRLTEAIAAPTLPTGARIEGTSVAPQLTDPFTIAWTLSSSDWAALPSVTIMITDALRAAAWPASSSILPPPVWALASKPVSTSETAPFEYRESIASVNAWLATIPSDTTRTTTLYQVENLASLTTATATPPDRLLMASTFQALPFEDPATGLVYARERWLDPATGTFLAPDPVGYRDSSNLYAFGGGDPVNGRDPTGENLRRRLAVLRIQAELALRTPLFLTANALYGDRDPVLVENVAPRDGRGYAIYINGVRTDQARAIDTGKLLAATDDINVDVIWNPTLPPLGVYDFYQAAFVNKTNVPDATTGAIVDQIRRRLRDIAPTERLRVYAHSQGGAILSSASRYLSADERARLDIVTFAAAAHSFPKGFNTAEHWVNPKDSIPVLFGRAFAVYDKDVKFVDLGFLVHNVDAYIAARAKRRKTVTEVPLP